MSAEIVKADETYTPSKLQSNIEALTDKYPKVLKTNIIGRSSYGQPIWAMKLGKGERNILIHGAHHGREWITSMIVMKMVEEYAQVYENGVPYHGYDPSLLDEISIWFVPMVNPDGVQIQQDGFLHTLPISTHELLMMNGGSIDFSRWKANGKGIDLNRQYPAGWEDLNGSAPFPFYQLYKGRKPSMAPEVKALEKFTKEINPQIAAAYHSSGRVVYWYYKTKLENIMRDWKIANTVAETTGYKLDTPIVTAMGGGYTDWFITAYERPAVTIEVGYEVDETSPPLSVFKEEWRRNRTIGFLLAQEAHLLKLKE